MGVTAHPETEYAPGDEHAVATGEPSYPAAQDTPTPKLNIFRLDSVVITYPAGSDCGLVQVISAHPEMAYGPEELHAVATGEPVYPVVHDAVT